MLRLAPIALAPIPRFSPQATFTACPGTFMRSHIPLSGLDGYRPQG